MQKWPPGGRWYAPKCVTPGVFDWNFHDLSYFITIDFWHFVTFDISWCLTFHDVWHFMTFDISWRLTFHDVCHFLAFVIWHFITFNVRSLLLGQDEKPFSKSMLNRKMVFRVTKSQSMKDKISFIWYHMIILRWGGVWGVVWLDGGEGGQYI